ncbi:NAD(P)/FAD-dependent oxidoreductase [Salegentibacter sp. JZCK2]|uniref:dihydrolipoyl dehydrogenase family protein n=1 Tax=Salegentibacter tibetensis TaxID=2873600 RepID=UPI001CCD729B|nr:NAD(P)/FAD-dependent oxidoreductase [Salegentibacter tibetensis]MBZ9730868.1 NAD(P)/FAD-dependent oxidoreductase [Salegentibacter tibetensis]
MKEKTYDLIVIGAGSGGLGAALGMQQLGMDVLLIDRNAKSIGGECLNTGCVPSKALIHLGKQLHQAKLSTALGLEISGKVDIKKIKAYIKGKQDVIKEHENIDYLKEKGLDIALGEASFNSENSVKLNNKIFKGRNIVIATGSSPRIINIPGTDDIPIFTNDSIFEINFIPKNFVFIGAGPVSLELGQAFSRLGSKVYIIDRGEHILKKEDSKISTILKNRLKKEGIQFFFNAEVAKVEGKYAILKKSIGEEESIPVDAIFMGLGRILNFDSLALEKGGIKTEKGKIIINKKLQTTNKRVFVSGDAADNLKFSHAAEMHNMLLINNFISPLKKKLDFKHFPWVTFTDPEVATFGFNENQLKKQNIKYIRLESNFKEDDRAITDDYEYGQLIVFIEKKRFNLGNAKILGGSMIAPNAGEIIQELILANTAGIKLNDFMNKIYPYPTAANIHKSLFRQSLVEQLKPWMKTIIKKWYRFKT